MFAFILDIPHGHMAYSWCVPLTLASVHIFPPQIVASDCFTKNWGATKAFKSGDVSTLENVKIKLWESLKV